MSIILSLPTTHFRMIAFLTMNKDRAITYVTNAIGKELLNKTTETSIGIICFKTILGLLSLLFSSVKYSLLFLKSLHAQ